MKQFNRTPIGKTLLFVSCLMAGFLTLALSGLAVSFWATNIYGDIRDFLYLLAKMGIDTRLSVVINFANLCYYGRYAIYPIILLTILVCIFLFAALMRAAGRSKGTEEISLNIFNRIPSDLMVCLELALIGASLAVLEESRYMFYNYMGEYFIVLAGMLVLDALVFLLASMDIAVRVKSETLFKNSIIYHIVKFGIKIIEGLGRGLKWLGRQLLNIWNKRSLIWKSLALVAGLSLLEFLGIIICRRQFEITLVLWFIEKLFLIPCVIYLVLMLRSLQEAGEKLAEGDLNYKVDTSGLIYDFKSHAEKLGSISAGMQAAVNERLKSERMKTELITNVSHDIKTPLTSIINYTGLILEEQCENPKINEYSEVLLRQSNKLKRLIEDLVEVSKASTGNMEVSLVPCDAGVFVSQVGGEYEERLDSAQLRLVTSIPEEPLSIMADGRRMWRAFDNLMNNICKYALEGTRVYLTLARQGDKAVFTFKNTSRDQLNISEEELMERFVRGDAARTTEGNGLGLSIARSMVELQGGSLKVTIDGDLFKAELIFPLAG